MNKNSVIRARWPGEAGQHLSMASVSATKEAIRAAQLDLGVNFNQVQLPLNPDNCARALDISSSEIFNKW